MGHRLVCATTLGLLLNNGVARANPGTTPSTSITASVPEPVLDLALGKSPQIDGNEAPGYVAFTFDDGPDPSTTPAVLAALARYQIPATFFVVGRRLSGAHGQANRDILAQTLASGHLVGSHTVSHPNLQRLGAARLVHEIDGAVRQLAQLTGQPYGLFRAPYGSLSRRERRHLLGLGLTPAFWSIDTLDWRTPNSQHLRARVFAGIVRQNGGVILMHDTKPVTAKTIVAILDDLEAENCRRLAIGVTPIWPVSLHYFLRDDNTPRPVPAAIAAQTAAYQTVLPERCLARGTPAPTSPAAQAPSPSQKFE